MSLSKQSDFDKFSHHPVIEPVELFSAMLNEQPPTLVGKQAFKRKIAESMSGKRIANTIFAPTKIIYK